MHGRGLTRSHEVTSTKDHEEELGRGRKKNQEGGRREVFPEVAKAVVEFGLIDAAAEEADEKEIADGAEEEEEDGEAGEILAVGEEHGGVIDEEPEKRPRSMGRSPCFLARGVGFVGEDAERPRRR